MLRFYYIPANTPITILCHPNSDLLEERVLEWSIPVQSFISHEKTNPSRPICSSTWLCQQSWWNRNLSVLVTIISVPNIQISFKFQYLLPLGHMVVLFCFDFWRNGLFLILNFPPQWSAQNYVGDFWQFFVVENFKFTIVHHVEPKTPIIRKTNPYITKWIWTRGQYFSIFDLIAFKVILRSFSALAI